MAKPNIIANKENRTDFSRLSQYFIFLNICYWKGRFKRLSGENLDQAVETMLDY
jgi:hypothetical protein